LLIALLMFLIIKAPTTSPPPAAPRRKMFDSGAYRAVLKERNVWLCALLSILLVAYLVVTWAFMPLFLTQVRGYDESTYSWLMGSLGISATFASFAIPALSDRIGRRGLMIALPFVATIVPLGAMFFAGPVWLLGAIFVVGWLVTGTMPLSMSTVPAESVTPLYMASALGVCMGAGELIGGVLAPWLAGRAADASTLHAPLWILTGLALAAGLVAFGIRETAPRIVGNRLATGEAT